MPPTTALQDEANATHGELLTLIAELKRDVHKIGTRLFKLQQNHLYRHVDGSPKTWEAYLEDHLHLGHAQANKYVKIAASFSEDYTAISKIEVLSLFLGWLGAQAMEVPADHATRTFVTPGGLAKRLDQLTVHEAELLFNPPATHPPAPPAAGPVGDSDLALYEVWKGRIPAAQVALWDAVDSAASHGVTTAESRLFLLVDPKTKRQRMVLAFPADEGAIERLLAVSTVMIDRTAKGASKAMWKALFAGYPALATPAVRQTVKRTPAGKPAARTGTPKRRKPAR